MQRDESRARDCVGEARGGMPTSARGFAVQVARSKKGQSGMARQKARKTRAVYRINPVVGMKLRSRSPRGDAGRRKDDDAEFEKGQAKREPVGG